MYLWARYLVSIASLTWAHQGGIGRRKYYNLSTGKVCTRPIAPLGEGKWLWRFLDTVIIGSSALYSLATGAIQMLIIIINGTSQVNRVQINWEFKRGPFKEATHLHWWVSNRHLLVSDHDQEIRPPCFFQVVPSVRIRVIYEWAIKLCF